MKGALLAVLVGLALLAGSTARADGAAQPRVGMLGAVPHAGGGHAARALASANPDNLVYGGGWVMRSNTTYAIYWIPSGYQVAAGYQTVLNRYFADVAAASGGNDNVYSAATQYYDTTGPIAYDSRFGGSYVDTGAFPASGCNDGADPVCLTDDQLQTEIQRVITHEGWRTGQRSLFFLMTPDTIGTCYYAGGLTGNDCTTNSFCAYHSGFYGTDGQSVVYAVQPYVGTISGCNTTTLGSPNGLAADTAINTISHEHSEAITDPWSGGWINASGNENGDLCAWQFGSSIGTTSGGQPYNQLINGHPYVLQQEWSNATVDSSTGLAGSCVQRYGSTPAPPANSGVPVVTGVAAVGKLLTTSRGTWSGSPTGYTYRWQRCAADGTGCTDISGATTATYRLAAADAGHTVRSEVGARNAGGASALAASVPTEVVVPLPAASHLPVVSGVAAVGKTLSTTDGTWNTPATSFAYRWLRCNSVGGSCSTIAGATLSTYALEAVDAGHTVEASVSATNAAGTTTAVSARTAVVLGRPAATKAPRISGRSKVGRRLAATRGVWRWTPSAYRFQWLRCAKGGGSCVPIARATHAAYRIKAADAGHRLRIRVTARNAAGSTSASSLAGRVVKR